ncbi:Hypothetical predicted protein [Lecanosticta acicola]|uniref:Uncharacterized protein n=1 Tax=Lecanosticta acicola TaxID=111012 RepID=A0AAI9EDP1_9PEZI|nr:Hypothetical predicted protein [Lecanosticta acicola]
MSQKKLTFYPAQFLRNATPLAVAPAPKRNLRPKINPFLKKRQKVAQASTNQAVWDQNEWADVRGQAEQIELFQTSTCATSQTNITTAGETHLRTILIDPNGVALSSAQKVAFDKARINNTNSPAGMGYS